MMAVPSIFPLFSSSFAQFSRCFAQMDADYSGFLSRDEVGDLLEHVYGVFHHLVSPPFRHRFATILMLFLPLRSHAVFTTCVYYHRFDVVFAWLK